MGIYKLILNITDVELLDTIKKHHGLTKPEHGESDLEIRIEACVERDCSKGYSIKKIIITENSDAHLKIKILEVPKG